MCYNGGGRIMKGAWERLFSNDALHFTVNTTFPSYVHQIVKGGKLSSNVSEGQATDSPQPGMYPSFITQSNQWTDGELFTVDFMAFPIEVIVNKLDYIAEMFFEYINKGAYLGIMYIMRGGDPFGR